MSSKIEIYLSLLIVLNLSSCRIFDKSWEDIYKDQQILFRKNQRTFQLALDEIVSLKMQDTTIDRRHFNQLLKNDSIVQRLIDLGIKEISTNTRFFSETDSCIATVYRFIPDSLWYSQEFTVFSIEYNPCDKRSKKDYHWKPSWSEHKHSFGQGDGWFLYSDTDLDP